MGFFGEAHDIVHPLSGFIGDTFFRGATAKDVIGQGDKPDEGGPAPAGGPKAPEDKATLPDLTEFGDARASMQNVSAPGFVGQGLTPIQQRSQIATLGTKGDQRFASPEAQRYYQAVLFNDLVGDEGTVKPGSQILPIEREYAVNVLGQQPRTDSPESFLSIFQRM
jgi:hypothetical protein